MRALSWREPAWSFSSLCSFASHTQTAVDEARLTRDALVQLAPPPRWQRAGQRLAAVLAGIEITYRLAGPSVTSAAANDDGTPSSASGDQARDLMELLRALGAAAQEHQRGVVFALDELQFAPVEPLGALITGLLKVAQHNLPVTLVAAGLPQTRGVLAEIAVRFTDGYPYFLQVFGDHLWRIADGDSITEEDAEWAAPLVLDQLDKGFFTFRTDRLTAAQRNYLRAMAESEDAEVGSGDIAAALGLPSSASVGQTRESLIRRGLIYSPRLGYASFTVPHFSDYLRRHVELELRNPRRRRREQVETQSVRVGSSDRLPESAPTL